MKEKIKEALIAATDEIFLEWQAKLHVVSGDVEPLVSVEFDSMLDKVSDQMVSILNNQPKLGVVKLEMLDGQIVDLSKESLACDMILKLSEVENYLREKELI